MTTNESPDQDNKLTNLTNGIANSLFGMPAETNDQEETKTAQEEPENNEETEEKVNENQTEQSETENGKLDDLSQGIANSLFGTSPTTDDTNKETEEEDTNENEESHNANEEEQEAEEEEKKENEEPPIADQNEKPVNNEEPPTQKADLEQSNQQKIDALLGDPKPTNEKEIHEPSSKPPNSPRSQSRKSSKEEEDQEIVEPENPPETPRRRNRLSQEDLQNLVNNVISGQTPIKKVPPQQLPQLITALKEARDERISKRKADEASVCDNYLLMARFEFNESTKNNLHKQKEEELKQRIAIAQQDYCILRNQLDLEDAQQASIDENKVIELLDRQQDDDFKFRNVWRSDQKLRTYNRTSNQLRSLRTQTILLLNARRYDEMKQVDNMARKQEEIETRENYLQMTAEYTQSHLNLQNKHTGQMKTLIDAQETKAEQKKALNKFQMDIAQKRIYNLQKQYEDIKDPNKFWALYHRNDRPTAGTKKSQTRTRYEQRNYTTLQLPPLAGPRSSRKLSRSARYG